MKHIFFIIVFCTLNFTNGQSCKVKIQAISSSYHGDCKSGLAHGQGEATGADRYSGSFKKGYPEGQGTYTWKNGDVYEGEWNKGMMDGEGKLTVSNGTVKTGFWKKGEYLGIHKNPFRKLDKSPNISSYTLNKDAKGQNNSIRFYLRKDQNVENNPEINVVVHNGNFANLIQSGLFTEIQNVTYPFKARVFFGTEFIEFEIYQPGFWNIKTDITNINGLNTKK